MPKIICPVCGAEWYGWALLYDDYTICDCCNAAIPLLIGGIDYGQQIMVDSPRL